MRQICMKSSRRFEGYDKPDLGNILVTLVGLGDKSRGRRRIVSLYHGRIRGQI